MLDDTVSAQPEPEGLPVFPLLAAADLQDHLMTVTNDLERLQRLLDDAGESLMTHFYGATNHLNRLQTRASELPDFDLTEVLRLKDEMAGAITALQFQDMATQLIAHTSQRLRNCADQLAQDTFGDDEDGAAVIELAPLKPNPVTQDEMDAGSVELF
jgi:hypothetical protein